MILNDDTPITVSYPALRFEFDTVWSWIVLSTDPATCDELRRQLEVLGLAEFGARSRPAICITT